ncbi:ATP-grasp domain-containing protein [Streptomyces sp. NPDC052101]|uniref:ATP-grasp domain-containing protein n=1 Tax=Streptomyces sp. NPDC052101 TaxID=3155763 RepID=UPI00343696A5
MIASLDDVERLLRPARFLGTAPRPLYLLPLLRTDCLAGLLTPEDADAGWTDRFAAHMYTLEERTRSRVDTLSGRDLDALMDHLPGLVGHRWRGRTLALAAYGTYRPHWQQAVEATGARLLVPDVQHAWEALKDKAAMRDWFRQLGVPTPDDVVVGGVDGIDYPALRRRFGDRFVVQKPRSAGGNGTYLVTDGSTAADLPSRSRWLVSEYVGDTTLACYGFVAHDGTAETLRAALQLAGIEETGAGFGEYSGSDFGAPALLPPAVLARTNDAMERIGRSLADLGYRGIFGADFAVCANSVVALEVNCRVLGSTWLLGEIELGEEQVPTLVRHMAERHGHRTLGKPQQDPADGVQLTVRHSAPEPCYVPYAPAPGVYALQDDRLVFRRPGYGLLECGADECVLVNLAREGTVLHPRGILGRLVTRRPLTAPDGRSLNAHGRRLVQALRRLYSFGEERI